MSSRRPLRSPRPSLLAPTLFAFASLSACSAQNPPAPPTDAATDGTVDAPSASWAMVGSNLPAALLSVSGTSDHDIWAVGASKTPSGPLVLHYDGTTWSSLSSGVTTDLWWVQAFSGGTALMAGASASVLRSNGHTFERLETPGFARQTIYGLWGSSPDDFYVVGSWAGRAPFIFHYTSGAFVVETLPDDLPRLSNGELPGLFKVWGSGDEVWAVGAAGALIHRKGSAPFTTVPTGTSDTLFTVSGTSDHLLAVGGGTNGVALAANTGGAFSAVTPMAAPLLQGVFAAPDADWITGAGGVVYTRPTGGTFSSVSHGLSIPTSYSLHSVFVDPSGGVWAAGGDVLTPSLGSGLLIHRGAPVAPIASSAADAGVTDVAAESDVAPAVTCPPAVIAAGKGKSAARRWDEQFLAAIRVDLPRPPVHARNLFHMSAAMWDAWAAYDTTGKGVFVRERQTATDVNGARQTAISYAAYDLLVHRYAASPNGAQTVACAHAVMSDLGLDPNDAHATGNDPIALGHRVAAGIIAATESDGANEAGNYADPMPYVSPNPALVVDQPGATLVQPAVWQPLNLSVAATQNGIVLPAGVQTYVGSQWGGVSPFAMTRADATQPWHDPGPPPAVDAAMNDALVEVLRRADELDPADATLVDISPASYGNNTLGANDGTGRIGNPVTGAPYASEQVKRADFGRVLAEFWADGPKSETPPGHWNVIANGVVDAPSFTPKLGGTGPALDPLAWDVRMYLALNGAVHDAAITAWDIKRRDVGVRPISLIRWKGGKGQSTDPTAPAYSADGLPLIDGLIEVITPASSAPGQRHAALSAYVGQIAISTWLGEPGDRTAQTSGCGWMRAVDWMPYQRRNFVTPAFPGFISGHSTFSRAAAEVLADLTGTPFFPGGLGSYAVPAGSFLSFEHGPSAALTLQWATYYDAADQAGQSRIWGGIHITPDDFAGRKLGSLVGKDAAAKARTYFDGTAP
jgi:hypothetical protein